MIYSQITADGTSLGNSGFMSLSEKMDMKF